MGLTPLVYHACGEILTGFFYLFTNSPCNVDLGQQNLYSLLICEARLFLIFYEIIYMKLQNVSCWIGYLHQINKLNSKMSCVD